MPQDFSVAEYLSHVLPPSKKLFAFLDWASGLIVLNETFNTWNELRDENQDLQKKHYRLAEAVTHEFIHCLQVICCGYPYKLVCDLRSVFNNFYNGTPPKRLRDTIDNVADEEIDKMKLILEHLKRDVNGVSTASIMEASALLAQKRHLNPELSPSTFRHFLDNEFRKDSFYRAAYDFAEQQLELPPSATFDMFQPLAFVSLCTSEPAETFAKLCKECDIPEYTKPQDAIEVFMNCVKRLGFTYLGSAKLAHNRFSLYHPAFSHALKRLDALQSQDSSTVARFFGEPHTFLEHHTAELAMPLLFHRVGTQWHAYLFEWMQQDFSEKQRSDMIDGLMCMSATFSGLIERNRGLKAEWAVFEKLPQDSPILDPVE
jgi:hypothetical protein